MRALFLSGFLLAGLASPASAQEPIPLSAYKVPLTAYVGTALADAYSTVQFMQFEGLAEGNPFISQWDHNLPVMFTIGGLMEASAVLAGYHFIGKKHKRLTQILLYGLSAFRGWIAWGNFRLVDWLEVHGVRLGAPQVPPTPHVFVPKFGESER